MRGAFKGGIFAVISGIADRITIDGKWDKAVVAKRHAE